MSLLNIPYMNIVLLKCYSSFRVRLYSEEKEERLHLFYCKSIFHMVFFACHVMVEIASCGSSALYCFNICMWEGKIMLSDLCCLLFTMFLALPVLWKKGRKWYEERYLTDESSEKTKTLWDLQQTIPASWHSQRQRIGKLKKATKDLSRGKEKGITRKGREELADISCHWVRLLWLP